MRTITEITTDIKKIQDEHSKLQAELFEASMPSTWDTMPESDLKALLLSLANSQILGENLYKGSAIALRLIKTAIPEKMLKLVHELQTQQQQEEQTVLAR